MHILKRIQMDLRSCESERSKRCKANEKGRSTRFENQFKMLKNCYIIHLDEKIRPVLCPSISGTTCDRDKPGFCRKRRSIRLSWAIKRAPNWIENLKNESHYHRTVYNAHVWDRALYCISIYWLYQYFGYTMHIVSFILVTQYLKRYIFA